MKKIKVAFAALAILSTIAATAQTATPAITHKQVNQHHRIQEGRKSGQLTKKEARHLNAREMKIQHDKKVAKADGVVTPAERIRIAQEQKNASRAIAVKKHNAQTK